MTSTARERLNQAGLELPTPPGVGGAYVQTKQIGDILYVSGQVAAGADGLVATGKVGGEVDFDTGFKCAQQCALNLLAQVQAAVGDLDKVKQVIKLTVFVAAVPDYIEPQKVANGASELINQVLGDAGAHCRSAFGVAVLPLDSPVEVEAILQV
jgi:enamine deaminase RidA (YjgF/YER057c/UK114 family)